MHRKPAFLFLALVFAASAPVRAGAVLDRVKSSGHIVLAHRESSIPFSYLDAQGRPIGYALELCDRLAEAVRRSLRLPTLATSYLAVTPATRIAAIADGKADLECGSTTNNAERRQKVAFTVPHYITGVRFVVRADSPITDLAGFETKTLVSTKGTTALEVAAAANRERLLRINVVEAPDHARAIEMVGRGEADGFVMDEVLLYGLISARPDPARFKVVGKFLTIEPLAIMLSRDDPEFKRLIDTEMKRLIASRDAYAIYERWFTQPVPPRGVALNLPMNHLLKAFWKYPSDMVPN